MLSPAYRLLIVNGSDDGPSSLPLFTSELDTRLDIATAGGKWKNLGYTQPMTSSRDFVESPRCDSSPRVS